MNCPSRRIERVEAIRAKSILNSVRRFVIYQSKKQKKAFNIYHVGLKCGMVKFLNRNSPQALCTHANICIKDPSALSFQKQKNIMEKIFIVKGVTYLSRIDCTATMALSRDSEPMLPRVPKSPGPDCVNRKRYVPEVRNIDIPRIN